MHDYDDYERQKFNEDLAFWRRVALPGFDVVSMTFRLRAGFRNPKTDRYYSLEGWQAEEMLKVAGAIEDLRAKNRELAAKADALLEELTYTKSERDFYA